MQARPPSDPLVLFYGTAASHTTTWALHVRPLSWDSCLLPYILCAAGLQGILRFYMCVWGAGAGGPRAASLLAGHRALVAADSDHGRHAAGCAPHHRARAGAGACSWELWSTLAFQLFLIACALANRVQVWCPSAFCPATQEHQIMRVYQSPERSVHVSMLALHANRAFAASPVHGSQMLSGLDLDGAPVNCPSSCPSAVNGDSYAGGPARRAGLAGALLGTGRVHAPGRGGAAAARGEVPAAAPRAALDGRLALGRRPGLDARCRACLMQVFSCRIGGPECTSSPDIAVVGCDAVWPLSWTPPQGFSMQDRVGVLEALQCQDTGFFCSRYAFVGSRPNSLTTQVGVRVNCEMRGVRGLSDSYVVRVKARALKCLSLLLWALSLFCACKYTYCM